MTNINQIKLIALSDIVSYTRLDRTIEPPHKKGDIFLTSLEEAEWLVKTRMAKSTEERLCTHGTTLDLYVWSESSRRYVIVKNDLVFCCLCKQITNRNL